MEQVLIDAKGVASMLSVSPRLVQKMNLGQEIPAPLKLHRRTLWRTSEIKSWVDAGCPARKRWSWDAM